MTRLRWPLAGLLTMALLAACAGSDKPRTAPPSTSPSPTDAPTVTTDPCTDAELEETEIGVDDKKIVVQVIADTGGAGTADLFRGSVDAVKAWAKAVNERGGLACRKVEVREWDSRLSPGETARGTLDACENALAMVGTSALLLLDTTSLATCADERFGATGVPDVAERAVEVPHQCNPTTFTMSAIAGACPYDGGVRPSAELVGPFRFFATLGPALQGTFLVPGDTPSTAAASISTIRAAQGAALLTSDAEIAATAHDRDDAVARALDTIESAGSTFVYSDANTDVLAELREKQPTDAGSTVGVWACSSTCYTQSFRNRGDDVEGTYVWLPHLPLEEAGTVPALAAYVDAIGGLDKATPSGVGAWAAATTFEGIVERIVERDGLNGINRRALLTELQALRAEGGPVGGGIYGPAHQLSAPAGCFMVLQLRDGEFRRVHPTAPGTLDCEPGNTVSVELDPTKLQSA